MSARKPTPDNILGPVKDSLLTDPVSKESGQEFYYPAQGAELGGDVLGDLFGNQSLPSEWRSLPFHAVANVFPLIDGDEFGDLCDDIKQNGLIEPIWLHSTEDSIIDGRNRYRACMAAGITPRFRRWDGNGSLIGFVLSLNLHRRHLTSSQKAVLALDVLPFFEEEAKERQRIAGEQCGRGADSLVKELTKLSDDDGNDGKAAAKAAALVGTNRQYVADAKRLATQSPGLLDDVRAGRLTLTQARRESVRQNAPSAPVMPTGRYRVLYVDPPWKYSNTQPDYQTEQADHYSLMSIRDLCALPVRDLAEDNAVLFMWTTSPILPEAFTVMDAWGFEYKSSFVWDKIRHNMGHYNSVRHEFLLVCVRGSCQPDVPKLFDSVVSIERTEHSRKPEEFRTIIDTIYPFGARVELFARTSAPGWDAWGNEANNAV